MKMRTLNIALWVLGAVALGGAAVYAQSQTEAGGAAHTVVGDVSAVKGFGTHFQTSDRCMVCHNQMTTPAGEDISIGLAWQTSMMGNGARDPYWMAGVRRELTDHPTATNLINDECTVCHMPMMRYESKLAGGEGGGPFAHLPPDLGKIADRLADDGISCTVCHQIRSENLGTPESFVGGFQIDETTTAPGERRVYGPYDVDTGHTTIMRSSSTFRPMEGKHIQSSELCATCHTLLTKALNAQGEVIGELPEQVPYQEWLHSEYKDTRSCQSCHMPVVEQDVPITRVFGEPREGFSRHTFVGGNFFMQRLLNQHRGDLGTRALPSEMEAAAARTIAHLQSEAATIAIPNATFRNGRVEADISVINLGGHKLPTAYPSRRVWIHLTVRDRNDRLIFESGAFNRDGSITGNDNDEDPLRFEPHYAEITNPDQVQIYESVMGDPEGRPTTGLLTALRFIKDNRLLPRGFDKQSADAQIGVVGEALSDPDFGSEGDTIHYVVEMGNAQGPFRVEAELWFQPISYRWAMNLKPYEVMEPQRFVRYYEAAAEHSAIVLVRTAVTTN
jgi:hypothetical protein